MNCEGCGAPTKAEFSCCRHCGRRKESGNAPLYIVRAGAVNLDDLMNAGPGSIIRCMGGPHEDSRLVTTHGTTAGNTHWQHTPQAT